MPAPQPAIDREERRVVVSLAVGVPPVNGHGQDGRATANDTTTERRFLLTSGGNHNKRQAKVILNLEEKQDNIGQHA